MSDEITIHALWSCSKAKEVWLLASFRIVVGGWKHASLLELFIFAIYVLSNSELVYILMVCRRIWQARNEE